MATIEEVNAKVEIVIGLVQGQDDRLRRVAEDTAGIKASLAVIPLHASPCKHDHEEYEEALSNLKTETSHWTVANTVGAVIALVVAAFAAFGFVPKP